MLTDERIVEITMELKPCPFCNAKPIGPTKSGGGDERNGYNFTMSISCKCGATISKLTTRWNRGLRHQAGRSVMTCEN